MTLHKEGHEHDDKKPSYIENAKRMDVYLSPEAHELLGMVAERDYRAARAEASLLLEQAVMARSRELRLRL